MWGPLAITYGASRMGLLWWLGSLLDDKKRFVLQLQEKWHLHYHPYRQTSCSFEKVDSEIILWNLDVAFSCSQIWALKNSNLIKLLLKNYYFQISCPYPHYGIEAFLCISQHLICLLYHGCQRHPVTLSIIIIQSNV